VYGNRWVSDGSGGWRQEVVATPIDFSAPPPDFDDPGRWESLWADGANAWSENARLVGQGELLVAAAVPDMVEQVCSQLPGFWQTAGAGFATGGATGLVAGAVYAVTTVEEGIAVGAVLLSALGPAEALAQGAIAGAAVGAPIGAMIAIPVGGAIATCQLVGP
jgi:hypothetical protein